MESERSSVYTVMKPEIDRMFPDQIYNDNHTEIETTGNGRGLRRGLVALSIGVGIFGNISGCNDYLADKISPRQEIAYENKSNESPSGKIPIDIDGAVNGVAVMGITYSLGRILLSLKRK